MSGNAAENALLRIEALGGHYVWDSLMFVITLNDCAVTDGDLELFATLPEVELLTIGHAPITDTGLTHLRHLKNLSELYLVDTKVTPEGVAGLRQCLPNTTISTSWPKDNTNT